MTAIFGAVLVSVYLGTTATGYLLEAAKAPAASAGQWISESAAVGVLLNVVSISASTIHNWLLIPMANWLGEYEYGRVFLDHATVSMTPDDMGLIVHLFALVFGSVAIGTVVFMAICRTIERLTQ
jgi:hypothetical protein